MSKRTLSVRSVFGLIGSYLWAVGMIFLGSFVGGILSGLVIGAFSLLLGAHATDFQLALLTQSTEAIGIAPGSYSASLASALWTAMSYLSFIGIWVVGILYLLVRRPARPILKTLSTHMGGNNARGLVFGLLVGFLANGLCALVAHAQGSISLSLVGVNVAGLILVFIAVFIQSSAEEFICRCYLYQRTLRVFGSPLAAVVLNAVLFGLLHLGNSGVTPISVINIILVGILFGLFVWKLDSPWAAFAAHASWNFMQAVVLGLPNSGNVTPFALFGLSSGSVVTAGFAYDPTFGIEGSPMATVVLALLCAGVYLWGTKHPRPATDIWHGTEADALDPADEPPRPVVA
ncbi:MAG: type II CAAX prenyl endopeptidase Rce1 family protein [Atopobiaceae bacterium]|jgi:membrane protease YdiL (CAAX protease family)